LISIKNSPKRDEKTKRAETPHLKRKFYHIDKIGARGQNSKTGVCKYLGGITNVKMGNFLIGGHHAHANPAFFPSTRLCPVGIPPHIAGVNRQG
jgi:hypothetical protein